MHLDGAQARRELPHCCRTGMLESYDAPHSLPCVAPRPLLVANGELDLRCHMPGVLPAVEAARKVRASENYFWNEQRGLHGFPPPCMLSRRRAIPAEAVGRSCSQVVATIVCSMQCQYTCCVTCRRPYVHARSAA